MTTTLSVLCADAPGAAVLVEHLARIGTDLLIDHGTPGYLSVRRPDDTLLFHIETPSLVHVIGEARRLLARDEPALPYWWLDIHTPTDAPPDAHDIAQRLADELTAAKRG